MKNINAGLCAGRHNIPVSEYIFDTITDPTDTHNLFCTAEAWVLEHCNVHKTYGCALNQLDMSDIVMWAGDQLTLYVTGLTVALGAVIAICVQYGVPLVLMHYDRSADDYYPQRVV